MTSNNIQWPNDRMLVPCCSVCKGSLSTSVNTFFTSLFHPVTALHSKCPSPFCPFVFCKSFCLDVVMEAPLSLTHGFLHQIVVTVQSIFQRPLRPSGTDAVTMRLHILAEPWMTFAVRSLDSFRAQASSVPLNVVLRVAPVALHGRQLRMVLQTKFPSKAKAKRTEWQEVDKACKKE